MISRVQKNNPPPLSKHYNTSFVAMLHQIKPIPNQNHPQNQTNPSNNTYFQIKPMLHEKKRRLTFKISLMFKASRCSSTTTLPSSYSSVLPVVPPSTFVVVNL